MTETASLGEVLRRTALYDLHRSLGARIVPFAGYEMPVQYASGILREHLHTRRAAGLFDVSHMGQARLVGPDHRTTATAIEKLVPGDIAGLAASRLRYTQLTNPDGGIIDDLMIGRPAAARDDGILNLVVNASRKLVDYDWIERHLPITVKLERLEDRALIALQGPAAVAVLAAHSAGIGDLPFMSATTAELGGIACALTRCGYTGEDGFEISVPAVAAVALVELLLADANVQPAGLGARDTLRLEAGLCLYGHDIDETTSPVEAGLGWSVGRRRREEGGFMGESRIGSELADGPPRRRVGLKPEGRWLARQGTTVKSPDGRTVGIVTSGGFGPTVNGPIAMGYVEAGRAAVGGKVELVLRERAAGAVIVDLPFVPHAYKR
ncbi:MAG: glycine cleavage system aminomethyltransferase GcvT [Pseudomonadota bacterium]|nr:glycine cleavage system aminomethyltransferase GcvT [Pseudomonadota bacterium]